MTLEETIRDLTSKTPSGGCCRMGDCAFSVSYCADIWEWEYRGYVFHDPLDLAEAITRDFGADSRLVSFYSGRIPDQRRWPRTQPTTAGRPLSQPDS